MNQSKPHTRKTCTLSESIDRRLNGYALAAGAAGVGMLALVPPSEAKIIYTPAHCVINIGVTCKVDLNHDGIVDFAVMGAHGSDSDSAWQSIYAKPAPGNGVRGFRTVAQRPWASALNRDAGIGSRQYFPGKLLAFEVATEGGGLYYDGAWINVKKRYLGLRFKIAGKIHYGWARLNVQVAQFSMSATLTGYAYETVPGKSIKAGQTSQESARTRESVNRTGPVRTVPVAESVVQSSPGSLGHLALGVRSRSALRRD